MHSRKPIVVVGSINLDLVAVAKQIPAIGETVIGTDLQMHPGGKGANQAVAVAQLGYPVHMIGCLGSDVFGIDLRNHLESKGVGTSGITTYKGPSGTALIVVSSRGENSIVVVPGANSAVTPELVHSNLSLLQGAGAVLTQLEIPIETVEYLATICTHENIPLILDPAPATRLSPAVLSATHWFTPNESEASYFQPETSDQLLTGDPQETAKQLLAMGCRSAAIKMGSKGVYLASQSGLAEFVPAYNVKAVDTTAAGDTFNGAFAVGLMEGKTPSSSAAFACAAAAISVTRPGAQPSMPTMAEIEIFLQHADQAAKGSQQ